MLTFESPRRMTCTPSASRADFERKSNFKLFEQRLRSLMKFGLWNRREREVLFGDTPPELHDLFPPQVRALLQGVNGASGKR